MFYTDAKQRAPLAEYDHSLVWTAVLLAAAAGAWSRAERSLTVVGG